MKSVPSSHFIKRGGVVPKQERGRGLKYRMFILGFVQVLPLVGPYLPLSLPKTGEWNREPPCSFFSPDITSRSSCLRCCILRLYPGGGEWLLGDEVEQAVLQELHVVMCDSLNLSFFHRGWGDLKFTQSLDSCCRSAPFVTEFLQHPDCTLLELSDMVRPVNSTNI